jgi:hypothetical protein
MWVLIICGLESQFCGKASIKWYCQVLVDLAGSERTALTGATGVLLHQSIGINKSLFVLRKVIAALAQQSAGQTQAAAAPAPARPGRRLCSCVQCVVPCYHMSCNFPLNQKRPCLMC